MIKEKGFTLLEVIVAITVMGIGIVLIMQLFSGGLRSGKVSRDYTVAVVHAREKMEEMLINPLAGTGDFGDGYKWQTEVMPYSLTGEDFGVLKITVKVSWATLRKDRAIEIITLKTKPEER
ncbi:MAG: type IV pilus modification PilV family protein [Nitrospirota bacterium]